MQWKIAYGHRSKPHVADGDEGAGTRRYLDTVRSELVGRGVGISDVVQMGPEGTPGSRCCFFDDPDGNTWAVQEYKRT